MGQIIKTISVSKAEDEFISDNNISPSRIIQNKVQEMIEFSKNGANFTRQLEQKIVRLQEIIKGYSDYLEDKGLIDEFLEKDK